MESGLPEGGPFFYPQKERRHMKKQAWQAAAVLTAVFILCRIPAAFTFAADGKEERGREASLTGRILHTDSWEQHRQTANLWYRSKGQYAKIRAQNTFWSGEKFVVEAEAAGEHLPETVEVHIAETAYQTQLVKRDGVYRGQIFEKEMLFLWGQREPERLTFVFEAEIDGSRYTDRQQITVDDREGYFMLHRKE